MDFGEILPAFFDPNRLIVIDDRKNYGETRWNLLGRINSRLFHVTFTVRGDITWIISARKANDREQRRYDNRQG
ncbi:BrnT family toxin [Neorhizobium petrolearium]|uniref:BrnT family toxin n=1 Tax=Neorhizobium petrolearium TaxID=515361 RepID=UPI003F18452B